jgi:hypothetical protein
MAESMSAYLATCSAFFDRVLFMFRYLQKYRFLVKPVQPNSRYLVKQLEFRRKARILAEGGKTRRAV